MGFALFSWNITLIIAIDRYYNKTNITSKVYHTKTIIQNTILNGKRFLRYSNFKNRAI